MIVVETRQAKAEMATDEAPAKRATGAKAAWAADDAPATVALMATAAVASQ